jgi:predicted phage terminase large subunit-like protein
MSRRLVTKNVLTPEERELWKTLEALHGADSLLDWVPKMSPKFESPRHLRRLAEVLVRAEYEPMYCWISVPPRHSKTETLMHYVAWRLARDPACEIAYITYEANLSYIKSRKMRELAEKAGVRFKRGAKNVKEWETTEGGRLIATGIGGPITGKGCNLLIIDDPIKNREEAESAVIREKTWDWLTSTAFSRIQPKGSALICHTRWHPDDMIGRIQKDPNFQNWLGIQIPAIADLGSGRRKALWPKQWPLEELDTKRKLVGEYDWSSLYMGEPRPKGGKLFNGATRYDYPMIVEEDVKYKIVIGVDPAATAKTSADYSAAVVMAFSGKWNSLDFRADILEVYRAQVSIPELVARLNDLAIKWAPAAIAVEAVGGFKAVPQTLRDINKRLNIIDAPATGDKFTRSLGLAACWNDGRVRIPSNVRDNPWIHDFLKEFETFTGVNDKHDDMVDAAAHCYNAAQKIIPDITNKIPVPIKSNLPFG